MNDLKSYNPPNNNSVLIAENNALKNRITELNEELTLEKKKIIDFLKNELCLVKIKKFIDTVNITDPDLLQKLMVDRGYIAVLVYICETLHDRCNDKETSDYVQKLVNEGINLYRLKEKGQNG